MILLVVSGVVAGPLAGVDLTVDPGLTVLVGEQGCGASTLLRVLAGRQEAVAGTVVGGPCALLTAPPGDEWQDADRVVDALGADHLVGREMWTLSGGERQRVRLARLLAQPVPVLLADEPLGTLDGAGVRAALDALRATAGSGRAVLAVCKSDLRAVASADRTLSLEGGRLVEAVGRAGEGAG